MPPNTPVTALANLLCAIRINDCQNRKSIWSVLRFLRESGLSLFPRQHHLFGSVRILLLGKQPAKKSVVDDKRNNNEVHENTFRKPDTLAHYP